MSILDFIYDGISLSSLGYIIVNFDGSSSVREVDNAARTFNNVSLFGGKFMPFTTAQYENRLEFTFDIIKDFCDGRDPVMDISEARYFMRWLARPKAHKLKFVCSEYANVYFEGSFNITDLRIGDDIYGLRCKFITTRPFGVHEPIVFKNTFVGGSVYTITDISDESGFIYPDIEIKCNESGNLGLKNSYDNKTMIINNCTEGEKIVITENLILTTSLPSHAIQDDFNYEFLKIQNNYTNRKNCITSTLGCDVTITYSPVIKVVI